MQAAALFVVEAAVHIRLDSVVSLGGGREEAEGVEVAAVDWAAFDEGIDLGLAEAEREFFAVADFTIVIAAIDHGPLVHAEAAELWGACLNGK